MKDVIISISGFQNFGEEADQNNIELVTTGKYSFSDGESKLSYVETEVTGMQGTTTSFTIEPFGVTLEREGKLNSRMVFEEGRKHHFLYETPFGAATMGVDTHSIMMKLGENGGDMEIDYDVDFDQLYVGRNKFIINVRAQQKDDSQWQI